MTKKHANKFMDTKLLEPKQLYEKMVRQLTTISAILAGFSLTNMAILMEQTNPNEFRNINFISVSFATHLFIGATVLGSFISFRLVLIKRIQDTEDDTLYSEFMYPFSIILFMTIFGFLFFLIGVLLLSFQMGQTIGIICAVMAIPIICLTLYSINRIEITIRKMKESDDEQ